MSQDPHIDIVQSRPGTAPVAAMLGMLSASGISGVGQSADMREVRDAGMVGIHTAPSVQLDIRAAQHVPYTSIGSSASGASRMLAINSFSSAALPNLWVSGSGNGPILVQLSDGTEVLAQITRDGHILLSRKFVILYNQVLRDGALPENFGASPTPPEERQRELDLGEPRRVTTL